jgi:hypothetical protein
MGSLEWWAETSSYDLSDGPAGFTGIESRLCTFGDGALVALGAHGDLDSRGGKHER